MGVTGARGHRGGAPAQGPGGLRRVRPALGRGRARLRGLLAARSLRGRVEVAPAARLAWGVRIAVAPGALVRVGPGTRIERRVRLEAGPGTIALAGGCRIGEGSRLVARGGTIELGAGARLGEACTLLAGVGISVGERSLLGDGVSVIDCGPVLADSERPIRQQGMGGAAVWLGREVVVGPRAAIGPGSTLGPGARVAAGLILGGVPPSTWRACSHPRSSLPR